MFTEAPSPLSGTGIDKYCSQVARLIVKTKPRLRYKVNVKERICNLDQNSNSVRINVTQELLA